MPYRSGLIQSAIGAVCAVAFLVSNSFAGAKPKHKQAIGVIQKIDSSQVILMERDGRTHTIALVEATVIFLNEKKLSPPEVREGRNASITFRKEAGRLVALQLDVFPTHNDFGTSAEHTL
jgi:hypothetical protein